MYRNALCQKIVTPPVPRRRGFATAMSTAVVGLGLLLSTSTTALGVIVNDELLTCSIVDRQGNVTTTVKASGPYTSRLRGYWFEFDSEYFWSKATVKMTLDVPPHLPFISIVQTIRRSAADGFAASAVPFGIQQWFNVPDEGVPGQATVRLYDHNGFLDSKTCPFRLVP